MTVATSSGLPGRPKGCSSLHFYTLFINQHNNHYNWSAGLFSLGLTSLSSSPCQYAPHNGSDPRWQYIHNPSLITCLIVLCSLLRSEASLLKDAGDDHAGVHRIHSDPLRRHLVAVMVTVMVMVGLLIFFLLLLFVWFHILQPRRSTSRAEQRVSWSIAALDSL